VHELRDSMADREVVAHEKANCAADDADEDYRVALRVRLRMHSYINNRLTCWHVVCALPSPVTSFTPLVALISLTTTSAARCFKESTDNSSQPTARITRFASWESIHPT
jgi:hypothetical protein